MERALRPPRWDGAAPRVGGLAWGDRTTELCCSAARATQRVMSRAPATFTSQRKRVQRPSETFLDSLAGTKRGEAAVGFAGWNPAGCFPPMGRELLARAWVRGWWGGPVAGAGVWNADEPPLPRPEACKGDGSVQ